MASARNSYAVEISFAAETIGHLGGLPITNSLLMSWITMAILFVVGLMVGYRPTLIPGRLQNAFEMIIDTMLNFFAEIMGSRKEAEKVFPIVFTFFIFILLSNWLGILPGIGAIGFEETAEGAEHGTKFIPLLRSSYSDLNMTLALAICSLVITHIIGISAIGIGKHIGKFISFKSPMAFFVGILETIAEVAKILSFSFRLFGNVFAGEVLLTVMLFLMPYIAPAPFLGMELFVGFIQALVFSMLTLVFIKVAMMQTEH
ncbi:MAG: F0F1 ATP synthase subunit A [Candidatus Spechtbacteria bacterium]|nr:F0F1 ATP synthase subunit A [Candidatus Spechtbacteria bacterium]